MQGTQKVPLRRCRLSSTDGKRETPARNQFRTITVSCFPVPGALPSEVLDSAHKPLMDLAANLPPGYRLEIGGENEEQVKGFRQLALVMVVSILCYLPGAGRSVQERRETADRVRGDPLRRRGRLRALSP